MTDEKQIAETVAQIEALDSDERMYVAHHLAGYVPCEFTTDDLKALAADYRAKSEVLDVAGERLADCVAAIKTLPESQLGMGNRDESMWWIKDELISRSEYALAKIAAIKEKR